MFLFTRQAEDGRARRHFALDAHGDSEHEVADPLCRAGVDDRALVALARRGQVAQGRDGVALDLLVLVVREQVDQRPEEPALDDRRLVQRVDRHVADARRGREDEREERTPQESQEGRQSSVLDNLELVFLCIAPFDVIVRRKGGGEEREKKKKTRSEPEVFVQTRKTRN